MRVNLAFPPAQAGSSLIAGRDCFNSLVLYLFQLSWLSSHSFNFVFLVVSGFGLPAYCSISVICTLDIPSHLYGASGFAF